MEIRLIIMQLLLSPNFFGIFSRRRCHLFVIQNELSCQVQVYKGTLEKPVVAVMAEVDLLKEQFQRVFLQIRLDCLEVDLLAFLGEVL